MTHVTIDPGICGLTTDVVAEKDGRNVKLTVQTGCEAVMNMFKETGDTFDAYELCLQRPGVGPLYDYASEKFPVHVSCPVICGIIKAAEVECKLALRSDCSIDFLDE